MRCGEQMSSVDVADVRQRLIAAAADVLAEERQMSMPLRVVAERAGTTTGAIQHHFGNKDGLLLAVLRRHGERAVDRLRGGRGAQPPPPPQVARAILLEFLPLDAERREESIVAHVFEGIAAGDGELASAYREQHVALADLLAEHLPGVTPAGVDLILAAVGGLRTDLLLHRLSNPQAVDLLDQLIATFSREVL